MSDYFEIKQGELSKYALKYFKGTGNLIHQQNHNNVDWELCVGVTGEPLIRIKSDSHFEQTDNSEKSFIRYKLEGLTNDNLWEVTFEDVIIFSSECNIEVDKSITNEYHCSANGITLRKTSPSIEGFDKIDVYLTNFDFFGNKSTQHGTINKRDKLIISVNNKDIEFCLLEHNDNILKLLKHKRINYGILSKVTMSVTKSGNNIIKDFINPLCWFLSSASLNYISSPIIDYYKNDEIILTKLFHCSGEPYNANYLIDNFHVINGIVNYFGLSFSYFQNLMSNIGLNVFINYILTIESEKIIEIKLAKLILAYEYLLTKYLISTGRISQRDVEEKDISIQGKIGMTNGFLRFIPSELSGDGLRSDVRNPLFHQGMIPLLSIDDKIKYFSQYYDLLLQIYLKIVNYKGDYISRENYKLKRIP